MALDLFYKSSVYLRFDDLPSTKGFVNGYFKGNFSQGVHWFLRNGGTHQHPASFDHFQQSRSLKHWNGVTCFLGGLQALGTIPSHGQF